MPHETPTMGKCSLAHFVSELDFYSFLADKKTVSACAFVISQIGEIANEVSDDFQMSNPAIPWKSIKGTRKTSLPALKEQLSKHIEN